MGNREEGRRWAWGGTWGRWFLPRSSRCQQLLLLGNRPYKADEFPCHGGNGFLTAFATVDQSPKAARHALLSALGDGPPSGRHELPASTNRPGGAGTKAVIPGGFHQHAARGATGGGGYSALMSISTTGVS